eukprot:TRINITY_DN10957_c0_g1_i1.p1 TRINITY_DN10957_c0_g1~~TRINITY_DN10957_c0_g1_i1.p1  ORF type:complete len:768 (+),score=101.27 TRINITY_DN10957_c0_g1_i1:22-2304(+)
MAERPRRMIPRPHQVACMEALKQSNIIANLPTGAGKTLVAVMAVDHFHKCDPGRITLFVAPTRPLVDQQARYFTENCDFDVRVLVLDQRSEAVPREQWPSILPCFDVVIGVAEAVRRVVTERCLIPVKIIGLVILDECHATVGNSPYVALMKGIWHRCGPEAPPPRVLGLTASFLNGKISSEMDLIQGRQALESLLQAKIFSPTVEQREGSHVNFLKVDYVPEKTEGSAVWEVRASELLGIVNLPLDQETGKSISELGSTLGDLAAFYYLEDEVLPRVKALYDNLPPEIRLSTPLQPRLEAWKPQYYPEFENSIVTNKVTVLADLLRKLKTGELGIFKGIVFVEKTFYTGPLARLIRCAATEWGGPTELANCIALPVTGTGAMTDSVRRRHLDTFRNGGASLLVATNALEEGIDVAECSFVVRFDKFHTTKAHIQGAGRARNVRALIYYFENDTELEQDLARLLREVAADDRHAADENQMANGLFTAVCAKHPFFHETSGAELNVYTCTKILHEYVQKVHPDFPAAAIYELADLGIMVRYPTRDGVVSVTIDEILAFWEDTRPEEVFDPARCAKMNGTEKRKRWCVYAALCGMVKRGNLTPEFQASFEDCVSARLACKPPFQRAPGDTAPSFRALNMTMTDTTAVPASPVSFASPTSPNPVPSSTVTVAQTTAATPAAVSNIFTTAAINGDPKSQINLLCQQRRWTVEYDTQQVQPQPAQRFQSTVTLKTPEPRKFVGEPAPSKKEAEKFAAARAVQSIT